MSRGNIEKRGETSYRIRVYLGKTPEGKPNYHRETVRGDREAAERRLTAILHEIDRGGYLEPSKVTLAEHMERWITDWVEVSGRSPKTVAGYRDAMKHILPELGHIPVQQLSAPLIQAYYSRKRKSGRKDGKGGLSASTVHSHHRALHAALEVAVAWGIVARNVCDATNPPQPRRRGAGRRWTDDEVAQFLDHIVGHRLYALYALCLTTGLRRGEVAGLRWQDIDFRRLQIEINQTIVTIGNTQVIQERAKTEESEEPITITEGVADLLMDHRDQQQQERDLYGDRYEDHDLVFCQPNGRPLWVANLSRRAFPKLCRDAGVPVIRFHDMRHSYATLLFESGENHLVVQRRLRHSRPSTTLDMYGHASDEAERRAAKHTDRLLPNRIR